MVKKFTPKYLFPEKLIEGLIKKRQNRFILIVEIYNKEYDCHSPSTGRWQPLWHVHWEANCNWHWQCSPPTYSSCNWILRCGRSQMTRGLDWKISARGHPRWYWCCRLPGHQHGHLRADVENYRQSGSLALSRWWRVVWTKEQKQLFSSNFYIYPQRYTFFPNFWVIFVVSNWIMRTFI